MTVSVPYCVLGNPAVAIARDVVAFINALSINLWNAYDICVKRDESGHSTLMKVKCEKYSICTVFSEFYLVVVTGLK